MTPVARPAASDAWPVRWGLILLATLLAVILFVLPLAAVVQEGLRRGWAPALTAVMDEDALSAMRLTLLVAAIAVPVNTLGGIAAAWAIAKCDFAGKRLLTTLIELLGKPSFGAGKIGEGERLAGFRRRPPVFFLRRIADQTQPFTSLFAFSRIIDK